MELPPFLATSSSSCCSNNAMVSSSTSSSSNNSNGNFSQQHPSPALSSAAIQLSYAVAAETACWSSSSSAGGNFVSLTPTPTYAPDSTSAAVHLQCIEARKMDPSLHNNEYLPPVTFHILTSSQAQSSHHHHHLHHQHQQNQATNPYGLATTTIEFDAPLPQSNNNGQPPPPHYVLTGVEELKAMPPTTLCIVGEGGGGGGGDAAATAAAVRGNVNVLHYRPNIHVSQQQQTQRHQQQQQQSTVSIEQQQVVVTNEPTRITRGSSYANGRAKRQIQQNRAPRPSISPDVSVDEDNDGNSSRSTINYIARTPPETIEWLRANYEEQKDASLPRCELYSHYKDHCLLAKLFPVNAASFGKLIRNVFPHLETRRLGTRGNSKYHYNGIRIKPGSKLVGMSSPEHINWREVSSPAGGKHRDNLTRRKSSRSAKRGAAASSQTGESHASGNDDQSTLNDGDGAENGCECVNSEGFLGSVKVPEVAIPNFQEMDEFLLPLGYTIQHVIKFTDAYTANCREVLNCIKKLQFDQVEHLWMKFWDCSSTGQIQLDGELSKPAILLDRIELARLCTLSPIHRWIDKMDLEFYQVLLDLLLPNVLRMPMNEKLNVGIRLFAANLENWVRDSVRIVAHSAVVKSKMGSARLLANALKRYTSFNHLLDVAKKIFEGKEKVLQMYQDLAKIDFSGVYAQAGWVCNCNTDFVKMVESKFKENLTRQCSLEEWIGWFESLVDQTLLRLADKNSVEIQAKQFLKNWAVYSSIILKELTLRSVKTFGEFHLIKLLSDECLFIIVEQRLAAQTRQPVLAVMAENWPPNYAFDQNQNCYRIHQIQQNAPPSTAVIHGELVRQYAVPQPIVTTTCHNGGGGFYQTHYNPGSSVSAQLTPIHTTMMMPPQIQYPPQYMSSAAASVSMPVGTTNGIHYVMEQSPPPSLYSMPTTARGGVELKGVEELDQILEDEVTGRTPNHHHTSTDGGESGGSRKDEDDDLQAMSNISRDHQINDDDDGDEEEEEEQQEEESMHEIIDEFIVIGNSKFSSSQGEKTIVGLERDVQTTVGKEETTNREEASDQEEYESVTNQDLSAMEM